jgi:hypothetical protein
MALPTPSACACPTPVTTNVPGSPGTNGTAGTNGFNAFSILSNNFIVPAINSSVTITVNQASWVTIGQNVFVQGAGNFSVNSVIGSPPTQMTITYLNYQGNTFAGNTISAGAQISPSGTQPSITSPLPIASGGTNAITKAAAQLSLGLGQNATFANVSGLAQALSNSATLIAGATVTVPATGLYLILGSATVEYVGATFAASQTITLTAVDTTSAATLATRVATTTIITTTSYPTFEYDTPFVTATLTTADVLQLKISVSVAPSAGAVNAVSASLMIVPLALS